jgi:hypothetical protein
VAVIVQVAPAAGADQMTLLPMAALNVPPLAVHFGEAGAVISTCSLTATFRLVSTVPSYAGASVLVVTMKGGVGVTP